jgi:flagellar biosynthesis/type III secretory pathway chaperone
VSRLTDHLQRQLESSRRLLEIVLSQRESIRKQDVESVLASLTDVQAEMGYRARLEQERDAILREVGTASGAAPDTLDLEAVLVGLPEHEASHARALSAELRGLIAEVGRIHDQNRILLRQELTFLDHLMRVMSGTPQTGYSPAGWTTGRQTANVVDARA